MQNALVSFWFQYHLLPIFLVSFDEEKSGDQQTAAGWRAAGRPRALDKEVEIMTLKLRNSIFAAVLIGVLVPLALSQGPLRKVIHYTINVNYAIRMGDYILPKGEYTLFQLNSDDPNLFALYKGDRTRSPIALIRTTRIHFDVLGYPEETRMLVDMDETNSGSIPVLRGWTTPGDSGWEINSVVVRKSKLQARVK
jgi:hypothetical protein